MGTYLRITFLGLMLWPIFCVGQTDFLNQFKGTVISELLSFDSVAVSWNIPGNTQIEMNDGLNNLYEQKFHLAIQNFTNVSNSDSSIWVASYYRGVAFKAEGQTSLAIADFQKVVKQNPNFIEGLLELGKAFQLQANFESAQKSFLRAMQLAPLSIRPIYCLAVLYMQKGMFPESISLFSKSLEIDPNFAPSKIKLSILDIQLGRSKEIALTRLNEVIDKAPANKEAIFCRMLINQIYNQAASMNDLNLLIALVPLDNNLKIMRGLMLIQQEKYSDAFADLQKVLQATTIDQDVFRGHQSALDQTIDIQSAGYHLLANIYGLDEVSQERIKKAYCLLLINKYKDAILEIKAVKKHNSYAFCLFLIGIAEEHMGDHQSAMNSYQAAAKLDSDIWDIHKKIAIYQSNLRNWKEAEIEFSKAISINKNIMSLYKLRGVSRFLVQEYQGASEDFTY